VPCSKIVADLGGRPVKVEMDKVYNPNPAYPVPAEAKKYVDSMGPKDRALHDLAVKLLGSSYFVEWSHGYKKWLAKQSNNL